LGKRRRTRLEAIELLTQPALGIAWQLVSGASTEAEAIEGDCGRKHARLLQAEFPFAQLNSL
jgi:hypothetical protein